MAWVKVADWRGDKSRTVADGGNLQHWREQTVDNSSKVFDPLAELGRTALVQVEAARVILTTDATVGNRSVSLEIIDGTTPTPLVFRQVELSGLVAASTTKRWDLSPWSFFTGTFLATTPHTIPHNLYLFDGTKLRIRDTAGIAAAGDDLLLDLLVRVF